MTWERWLPRGAGPRGERLNQKNPVEPSAHRKSIRAVLKYLHGKTTPVHSIGTLRAGNRSIAFIASLNAEIRPTLPLPDIQLVLEAKDEIGPTQGF